MKKQRSPMRQVFAMVNLCLITGSCWLPQANEVTAQETPAAFLELRIDLQTALDQIIIDEPFPGVTLAVSLPDGRVISLASGVEDAQTKTPMPVAACMLVGSTGKTFASAVALQLIAEGKFSLDDALGQFFAPEESDWYSRLPNSKDLTIRSIMNHTSGLPRYVFHPDFLDSVKKDPQRNWTPRECVSLILDSQPLHQTGKRWAYSDTNYLLLGMILEKVTAQTFYDLAQQRLLTPLNLRSTLPTTQAELPSLCQGHIGAQDVFGLPQQTISEGRYCMNPSFEWCGGGFLSNVEDLANWMRWLHTGKVLSPNLYDQLVQPVDFRTAQPAEMGYGLGTFVWQTEQGTFLGHAGMMPGYLTQIEFSTRYRYSIAMQTNTDEGLGRQHHAIVQRIAKRVDQFFANGFSNGR